MSKQLGKVGEWEAFKAREMACAWVRVMGRESVGTGIAGSCNIPVAMGLERAREGLQAFGRQRKDVIWSDIYVIYYLNIFLNFGLHCCMGAFLSCSRWGFHSSCGAWASHCCGFSCCTAWTLGMQTLVIVALYLWAQRVGSSQTRTEPMFSALPGRFLTTDHQESPRFIV